MEEEIEEYLEENFEFIKFTVKYLKIKSYEIIIDLHIIDNNKNKIIRTSFDYVWSSHSTTETNLSTIRYYVNKSIQKMFWKEN